jgi:hypothetical protein
MCGDGGEIDHRLRQRLDARDRPRLRTRDIKPKKPLALTLPKLR